MPGRGPAPKAANKRARRNAEPVTMRILPAVIAEQPELPTRYKAKDDEDGTWRDEVDWPIVTVRWWAMWRDSPLAAAFTYNDWSFLMDTALLHAEFWEGNVKLAPELRLREAKFGATPEDRARLRITFAQAEEAETKTATRRASSRDRFGGVALPQEATGD